MDPTYHPITYKQSEENFWRIKSSVERSWYPYDDHIRTYFICVNPGKCPETFIPSETHCYRQHTEALTWYEARNKCVESGGDLADLKRPLDGNVSKLFNETWHWLGYSSIRWSWESEPGYFANYTNWVEGRESTTHDSDNRTCVTVNKLNKRWMWTPSPCTIENTDNILIVCSKGYRRLKTMKNVDTLTTTTNTTTGTATTNSITSSTTTTATTATATTTTTTATTTTTTATTTTTTATTTKSTATTTTATTTTTTATTTASNITSTTNSSLPTSDPKASRMLFTVEYLVIISIVGVLVGVLIGILIRRIKKKTLSNDGRYFMNHTDDFGKDDFDDQYSF